MRADIYFNWGIGLAITMGRLMDNGVVVAQLPEGRPLPEYCQIRVARLINLIERLISPNFSPDDKLAREHSARVLWSSVFGISALETQNKLPANQSAKALIFTLIETYLF